MNHEPNGSEPEQEIELPHRRRLRLTRHVVWLVGSLLMLLILLAFAPAIVAVTPLKGWALGKIISSEQGTLQVHQLSLGWFSPIEAQGLELRDLEGNLLVAAPRFAMTRTLWQLIGDQSQLGVLRFEDAEVTLKLRPGGSNWEDFVAPWLVSDPNEPSEGVTLAIQVEQSHLVIADTQTGAQWDVQPIDANYVLDSSGAEPMQLKLAGNLPSQATPGMIDATVQFPDSATATPLPLIVELKSQHFPLSIVAAVLRRCGSDVAVAGALNSDVKLNWSFAEGPLQLHYSGSASADQLRIATGNPATHLVALQHIEAPCQITISGGRLLVEKLQLLSDAGEVQASGVVPLPSEWNTEAIGNLIGEGLVVDGALDVAKLAQILPGVLRLRDDTEITAGRLDVHVRTGRQDGRPAARADLELSSLAAVAAGNRVAWHEPLTVQVDGVWEETGLVLNSARCRGPFFELLASGNAEKAECEFAADMGKAAVELGQFFDLGGMQLAGQARGQLSAKKEAANGFAATAKVELTKWQLSAPNRPPWNEESLQINLAAAGDWSTASPRAIHGGTLVVRSGDDLLNAKLIRPVELQIESLQLPLLVELRGELARWLARSSPFFSLENTQLAGSCELNAQGTFGAEAIDLDRFDLRIGELSYNSESFEIAEPNVEIQAQGRWIAQPGRVEIPDLLLACPTLSLRAQRAWCDWPAGRPRMAGSIAFNADAKRLRKAISGSEIEAIDGAYRLEGKLNGKCDISHQGQQTTAQLDVDALEALLRQVVVDERGRKQVVDRWQEPKLHIAANAVYDQSTDRLQIQSVRAESNSLVVSAAGAINELTGEMIFDANGTVNYDLAQWTPLLREQLAPDLVLVGRDTAEFRLGGPLVAGATEAESLAMRLTAKASAGWQAAGCYGLMFGPARLEAQLANGQLQFAPLQVGVNEGTLTATPLLKIAPGTKRLTIAPGQVLGNVRFSPENCDQLFKYIAPVVAEATRCDGKFSLELAECKYKFEKPQQSDLAGKLTVHQLDVLPGPLAEQYVLLGKQIESLIQNRPLPAAEAGRQGALMRIDPQAISFRLENGRVYHDRMVVRAGPALIYTSGSVGLDQSLAIDTEIPIQDIWLEGRPYLQGLRGQVLRVPIRGSLSNPKADGRALAQASAQILRGAAQSTISNELNKQLNRFLPPAR